MLSMWRPLRGAAAACARRCLSSSSSSASSSAPGGGSGGDRHARGAAREQVASVFRSVAQSYDAMNDAMSAGAHRLWKDAFVSALALRAMQAAAVGHGARVKCLDVAGGTGDIAFRMLRELHAAREEEEEEEEEKAAAEGAWGDGQREGPDRGAEQLFQTNADDAASPAAAAATDGETEPEEEQQQQQRTVLAPPESVVVYDINESMLHEGRKRALDMLSPAMQEDVAFVQGDAEQLPFPDDTFDVYTIVFGLRNVHNRMNALREAHRVLRNGGRFMCMEFSTLCLPQLQAAYDVYSDRVIPALGGLLAGDRDSYQYLVDSIRAFPPQEEMLELTREAGFSFCHYWNYSAGIAAVHSGIKWSSSSKAKA